MDMSLELVPVPVSDIDPAKASWLLQEIPATFKKKI